MLEHVPRWLGAVLKGVRAGADKLAIVQPDLGTASRPAVLEVEPT